MRKIQKQIIQSTRKIEEWKSKKEQKQKQKQKQKKKKQKQKPKFNKEQRQRFKKGINRIKTKWEKQEEKLRNNQMDAWKTKVLYKLKSTYGLIHLNPRHHPKAITFKNIIRYPISIY